ncbi:hypothetical protein VZT92_009174 [Zoarces viviparus]|uniref:Uncharacterized protein n=1 Tax=Zoarces viviparus TaxID=48416 RepID=A0AAW1FH04_ZOAVI
MWKLSEIVTTLSGRGQCAVFLSGCCNSLTAPLLRGCKQQHKNRSQSAVSAHGHLPRAEPRFLVPLLVLVLVLVPLLLSWLSVAFLRSADFSGTSL